MANGDPIFASKPIRAIAIALTISAIVAVASSFIRVEAIAGKQGSQEVRLCTVERKVDETQVKSAETREKVEREGAKNDARYEAILRTLERIERKLP